MESISKLVPIIILAFSIGCDKPEELSNQPDIMTYLTKPDHQAVILIGLKHDIDTTKVNDLIQSYLDHYDLIHVMANAKDGDLLQALNPRGQFKVIDSLSVALSIPKKTSASILFDYILFTKKCDAEDNSYYEPAPEGLDDYP